MSRRFEQRVVVVTGAGSGIGRAAAQRLADEGGLVACWDVDETGVQQTASAIVEAGGQAIASRCDITDEQAVVDALAAAERRLGFVDVLFANAGVEGPLQPVADVELADWRRVIDVNLTGTFLTCKHAIRSMRANGGGAIVATASILSHVATPLWGPYSASKGGLLQLVRSLATDYASDGIRVNCICPGGVATALMNRGLETMGTPESERREHVAALATPEQIAAAVAFLASDDAELMNGASLMLDQGFTAT
ncbi:MAG TPA: SDR family NAD(P)-dependent oxidoreductase [Baekduia sp.]|nr:SDR family NAD(P)-dependent oxidoreductase [Baekduia sp.]